MRRHALRAAHLLVALLKEQGEAVAAVGVATG